jgi:hypothetical protein
MLMLAFLNRASGAARVPLQRMFLYVGSMAVCESLLLKLEYISRPEMHGSAFYAIVMLGTLGIIVALGVASQHQWACTIVTSIYTLFGLAFLWVLPLFPAQPKLGPVYTPVTHFIPWEFPLLVVVPAFVTDVILQRTSHVRAAARALLTGVAFFATFFLLQWPFANFLMTPGARNWFFGTGYRDYGTPATSLYARFEFVPPETADVLIRGLSAAVLISCLMAYAGILAGRAMQRVRR